MDVGRRNLKGAFKPMGRMEQRRQEARKKRKIKRWIFIPLLVIVLPLTLFGTYLGYKVVTTASDMQEDLARGEKSDKRDEAVDISKDHFSVLFLGVDTDDPNENSRADALILATFNREDSSIKLLSIPRDSLVDIPGRQNRDKINHAHAFGGVDLTIDTVENMLDIPVDFYTKMNFHGFVDIIDAWAVLKLTCRLILKLMVQKEAPIWCTLKKDASILTAKKPLATYE